MTKTNSSYIWSNWLIFSDLCIHKHSLTHILYIQTLWDSAILFQILVLNNSGILQLGYHWVKSLLHLRFRIFTLQILYYIMFGRPFKHFFFIWQFSLLVRLTFWIKHCKDFAFQQFLVSWFVSFEGYMIYNGLKFGRAENAGRDQNQIFRVKWSYCDFEFKRNVRYVPWILR